MQPPEFARLDDTRDALLAAAVENAPFDGWTTPALARAAADAGLDAGTEALACPAGPIDLIDFWARRCDEAAEARLLATDLDDMKIRARVALGVKARVEAIGEERREAARRATARMALPDAAPRGAQILWRAADRIWRAIGDRSTDGAHYSKRVVLSGVLASVLARWLQDDADAAWETLDRRIDGVMQFEAVKARTRKLFENAPNAPALLARLRYGPAPL